MDDLPHVSSLGIRAFHHVIERFAALKRRVDDESLPSRNGGKTSFQCRQIFRHSLEHGVIRARSLDGYDADRRNRRRRGRCFRLFPHKGLSVSHRRCNETFSAFEGFASLTLIVFPEFLVVFLRTDASSLTAHAIRVRGRHGGCATRLFRGKEQGKGKDENRNANHKAKKQHRKASLFFCAGHVAHGHVSTCSPEEGSFASSPHATS